jgi:hypothetical protein
MNEVSRCEFIDVCQLFAHLCRIRDTVYRQAYCEGDYRACERRALRLLGHDTPDDLLPNGLKLHPDGSALPSMKPHKCDTRLLTAGLVVYWVALLIVVLIYPLV